MLIYGDGIKCRTDETQSDKTLTPTSTLSLHALCHFLVVFTFIPHLYSIFACIIIFIVPHRDNIYQSHPTVLCNMLYDTRFRADFH